MRLTPEARLELLKKVFEEGQSVTSTCKIFGISRFTFYKWAKFYRQSDNKRRINLLNGRSLEGDIHPKSIDSRRKKLILESVLKNPAWSSHKISEYLKRYQKSKSYVSNHGVHNFLKKHHLERIGQRWVFASKHPVKTFLPTRLSDFEKYLILEEYLHGKLKVTDICRKYQISRYTFYAWLNKYNKERTVSSLAHSRPIGELHPRALSREVTDKVLGAVIENPEHSVHKLHLNLAGVVGHHGIQNVLARENLNTYELRRRYAEAQVSLPQIPVAPAYVPQLPLFKLRWLIAPFVTIPKLWLTKPLNGFLATLAVLTPFTLLLLWFRLVIFTDQSKVGLIFASIALTFGLFFFIYSLKYYLTILLVLRLAQRGHTGKESKHHSPLFANLDQIELGDRPYVSIHVAVYNEKRVIERLISACSSQEWPNYEIVIVDDSNDETTEIALKSLADDGWKVAKQPAGNDPGSSKPDTVSGLRELELFYATKAGNPIIKYIHRFARTGFKGGALQEALRASTPKAKYIIVFDADFVPYPDTIEQFVKYFTLIDANEKTRMDANISMNSQNLNSPINSRVAAVQGYQWHVLNKSQTWVTRGVRTEYAGSYVIERSGEEIYGGLKQIAGSVYCIRSDLLRQFGWGTSITEDFELTLRLYEAGYKVAFTPFIQAPAEAVSTLRRLVRQRMRWAEGSSRNIKIMLPRMLFGRWVDDPVSSGSETGSEKAGRGKVWVPSKLTRVEKLEFGYLAPYYLQAAFFVVGTLAWFISEAILKTRLPFWTSALGWSLVFTNLLSLPLMNIVGLFLEESDERDYLGVLSFIALSYIIVPFQAYAAVKGFLEKEEGPWFRTPKTGAVTDVFDRSRFSKFFGNIFGKPATAPISADGKLINADFRPSFSFVAVKPEPATANRRRRMPFLSKSVLAFLLIITLMAGSLSLFVPQTYATNRGADYGQYTDVYCVETSPGVGDAASNCKISYKDFTNSDLRMADCDNATCSSGGDRAVDTTTTRGDFTSIYCLSSTDCKISYRGGSDDLSMADCDNPTCDIATLTQVDNISIQEGTGIYCLSSTDCKIVYNDVSGLDLKFADCDNSACTAGNRTLTIVDSVAANTGTKYPSIYCPAANDCKIAYHMVDTSLLDLKFANCDNATCSTVTLRIVDATNEVGLFTSIYCPAANDCKISYKDAGTNDNLKFVDCNAADCNVSGNPADDATITTVDTTGNVGSYTSIYCPATDDCKISYYDVTNGDLKFVDCGDSACTSTGRTIRTLDGGGESNACSTDCVGQYTSIYCPATDDCKISYYDVTNGDLMFADCNDETCSAPTLTTVALTVPEFIGFLIPVAPFLPKVVRKVQAKLKKWRKEKKLWKPKR